MGTPSPGLTAIAANNGLPGARNNLVKRANAQFVQCVREGGLSGVGQGPVETVSPEYRPSTECKMSDRGLKILRVRC
jgi:hypothetical protein